MPNWCECELSVTGNACDIKRFIVFAAEDDNVLSANKFIPYPKKYADADRRAREQEEEYTTLKRRGVLGESRRRITGFSQGGYRWCIDNWGTKWGFCDTDLVDENTNRLLYHFNTAWSPPLPLIKAMGEQFPALTFYLQYFEGGAGFQGEAVFENGFFTDITKTL